MIPRPLGLIPSETTCRRCLTISSAVRATQPFISLASHCFDFDVCYGVVDLITGGIENEFDMRHAPFIRTCFENHRLALAKQYVQVRSPTPG